MKLSFQKRSSSCSRCVPADSATSSASAFYLSVRFVICVTLWALGSSAHAFASVSALNIYQSGDWFHMCRVDAATNAAQVVYLEPFGDRANEQTIRCSVSFLREFLPTHPKTTVPASVEPSRPDPATGLGNDVDVAHKAFFVGRKAELVISHPSIISGVAQ